MKMIKVIVVLEKLSQAGESLIILKDTISRLRDFDASPQQLVVKVWSTNLLRFGRNLKIPKI